MASFAARDHEVTLIARSDGLVSDDLDPRISVRRMRPYAGLILGRVQTLDGRSALQEVLAAVRPDVLHVHDMTTGFGWLARLSGFHPYVVTAWGSDVYLARHASWQARLARRLTLAGADLVTLETHDLGRAAVRAGAHADRIRLIQFGVDTEQYRPGGSEPALRASLGLDGQRIVFSPRQIAPLYDQLTVIRAVRGLPSDVAVVMSAKNAAPDHLRDLERVAREIGIIDRLVVVPTIAQGDMPRYLRLADVVISIPRSDSISVSVLEAMSCGRPVVVSDLPSPREWLDEVSPDLIAPIGDVDAVAAALARALSLGPAETERRGAVSRRIVVDRAEHETNMTAMEGFYQTLVERRDRSA